MKQIIFSKLLITRIKTQVTDIKKNKSNKRKTKYINSMAKEKTK